MIKLYSPMTRLDHMSRADFATYYVERHTKVGGGFPGHLKYVGSPAIQSANGDAPPFDAIAELYFEDLSTLAAAFTHELWDAARRDHPSVVSGRLMFVTEEHTVMAPPAFGSGAVKYVALISRRDVMSRSDFQQYWMEKHIPLALETPGLRGYRACPAVCSANGDSLLLDRPDAPQFDGVVEMWFDSVEAFNESFAQPHWDALRDDYYQHFAMNRVQLVVEEHLVFDHTTAAA
jgi:uncharacterized protein (TIGR02118 family)